MVKGGKDFDLNIAFTIKTTQITSGGFTIQKQWTHSGEIYFKYCFIYTGKRGCNWSFKDQFYSKEWRHFLLRFSSSGSSAMAEEPRPLKNSMKGKIKSCYHARAASGLAAGQAGSLCLKKRSRGAGRGQLKVSFFNFIIILYFPSSLRYPYTSSPTPPALPLLANIGCYWCFDIKRFKSFLQTSQLTWCQC